MAVPDSPAPAAPSGALPTIEDWRRLVEKGLKGHDFQSLRPRTRDGIEIEPLYERRRDTFPLAGRGSRPWVIVQEVELSDPHRANDRIRADVEGGATGISVRLPGAHETGSPLSSDGVRIALDAVDLARIHLRLDGRDGAIRCAELLSDFVIESGLAPELADIAFCLDPLATTADTPTDPAQLASAFLSLRQARFRGPLAMLDARRFHAAGATQAQELAAVLGAAVWWLRATAGVGLGATEVLPLLGAGISIDGDVIMSIAKLRALRLLWARFQEVCDSPKTELPVHAETSRRMLTRDDLIDNLLRNTLAAFAAGVGGANSILVVPHTAPIGVADRNARALARNLQHLLMEESELHRVGDPGAGSGAIEALTDSLAEKAWSEFQDIEREGGLIESLRTNRFQIRTAAGAHGPGEKLAQ